MTDVSDALWRSFLGELPKPEGCTYWQFAAIRDAVWQEEYRESAVKMVARLRQIADDDPSKQEVVDDLIAKELESIRG